MEDADRAPDRRRGVNNPGVPTAFSIAAKWMWRLVAGGSRNAQVFLRRRWSNFAAIEIDIDIFLRAAVAASARRVRITLVRKIEIFSLKCVVKRARELKIFNISTILRLNYYLLVIMSRIFKSWLSVFGRCNIINFLLYQSNFLINLLAINYSISNISNNFLSN